MSFKQNLKTLYPDFVYKESEECIEQLMNSSNTVNFKQARTQLLRRVGGCTLSLSGPYVSKEKCFCLIKIRNIIVTIIHCWPGKTRNERRRRDYTRGVRGHTRPGNFEIWLL